MGASAVDAFADKHFGPLMCNLYSITTNQGAIAALFRVMNRYVGNQPPMPLVFPDYPAPVIRVSKPKCSNGDKREHEHFRAKNKSLSSNCHGDLQGRRG
jgi:hypothetical protein